MDKNNPGLDMRHGFIHHIRRNQFKRVGFVGKLCLKCLVFRQMLISRDEYDKEIRTKGGGNGKHKKDSAKHPDKQVYRPQREGTAVKESVRTSSPGMRGRLLYKLEYTDSAGRVHKVEVHEFDDPSVIARRLANDAKIPRELLETLEWKIQQDIAKRNS